MSPADAPLDVAKRPKRPKCPECGIPFSDWFTWTDNGWSYCWPCYRKTGRVIMEPGALVETRKEKHG
jgi:hypothetical protein